jgi:hypothetical protein
MKTIKQAIIILLAVLLLANVVSYFVLGVSDRKVPPQISCPSEILEISAKDSESALLVDVTASDEQDGDLTHQITVGGISKLITNDTAKVTYLVFDSDNNMASCVRQVRYVDYHRPTFEVTEPLVYASSEEVVMLPRLKAIDVVDGDISKSIRVSTLEPTDNSEIFHVTIQVSNSVGDTSWVTLPVLMLESNPLRPELQLSDSLIYLEQGAKFTPSAYLLSLKVPGMTPSIADVTVDNEVDTGKPGTYYVTYTYSANGSTGTAILTVVVQ